MANLGLVQAELNGLQPPSQRPIWMRIFQSILGDLRFGRARGTAADPLENFGGCFLHVTTPDVAGEEFSIPHQLGRDPYLAIPCLLLDAVGSRTAGLQVTRAADDKRIYLACDEESVPLSLIVEG